MNSDRIVSRCIDCGREFSTAPVTVFGKTFVEDRVCDLCRETEKATAGQRRAELHWSRVMVPAAYHDCSFDDFEPVPGAAQALAVCRQWAKEYRAGTHLRQGLFLHGQPGRGKTHLAVALLREIVWSGRGGRALFLNVPDWLRTLRESFDEGEPPPKPDGYDVVVLDDLGAEDWSPWARDQIYGIVNKREQQALLLFVTSNLARGELRDRIGSRMMSRLSRLTREVHVDARRDFREVIVERDAA